MLAFRQPTAEQWCVIGDIIAVPFAALTEVTLAGSKFFGHTLVSFVAAFFLGILFQYLPVREMVERSRITALIKAIKADTISLLVFQAGMFICLWFFRRGDLNSAPDTGSVTFWGQMVVAIFTGDVYRLCYFCTCKLFATKTRYRTCHVMALKKVSTRFITSLSAA